MDVLSSAPVLAPPDYSKLCIVDCDASNDALGSVLSRVGGDGFEHPVYFYSRTFNAAERNTQQPIASASLWWLA